MLHAGIALLELLQVLDQLVRRAGEPGAELHVVVDRRHAGRLPAAAARDRRDLRPA